MLLEMSASAAPYVLGDKGYLCSDTMEEELLAEGVKVIAPVRENMAERPGSGLRGRLNARRRIVETASARLAGRLEKERIWTRDRWHLTEWVARTVRACPSSDTAECASHRWVEPLPAERIEACPLALSLSGGVAFRCASESRPKSAERSEACPVGALAVGRRCQQYGRFHAPFLLVLYYRW